MMSEEFMMRYAQENFDELERRIFYYVRAAILAEKLQLYDIAAENYTKAAKLLDEKISSIADEETRRAYEIMRREYWSRAMKCKPGGLQWK